MPSFYFLQSESIQNYSPRPYKNPDYQKFRQRPMFDIG